MRGSLTSWLLWQSLSFLVIYPQSDQSHRADKNISWFDDKNIYLPIFWPSEFTLDQLRKWMDSFGTTSQSNSSGIKLSNSPVVVLRWDCSCSVESCLFTFKPCRLCWPGPWPGLACPAAWIHLVWIKQSVEEVRSGQVRSEKYNWISLLRSQLCAEKDKNRKIFF